MATLMGMWGRASRIPRQAPVSQITDGFAGASANLTTKTTDTGSLTWSKASGANLNLSGSGTCVTTALGPSLYTLAAGLVDCTVSAELTIGSTTNAQPGVVLRYQDANNYLSATFVFPASGAGTLRLIQTVSGTATVLVQSSVTYSAGMRLYASIKGTLFRLWCGSGRAAINTSLFPSASGVGIWCNENTIGGIQFDNFLVTVP